MIAVLCPYPADAGPPRFLNSEFRSPFHDQVPERVITVYKRGARPFVYDSNVRPGIDAACFDLCHVLLQSENAMGVAAARVGGGHPVSHLGCILRGNSPGR